MWVAATLAAVPASVTLWSVGAQAWCGEEIYDTPPGSTGDALCNALVEPVVPWALLAAIPFLVVVVGGLAGIRRRDRRLFVLSLGLPFLLVVVAVMATLAAF